MLLQLCFKFIDFLISHVHVFIECLNFNLQLLGFFLATCCMFLMLYSFLLILLCFLFQLRFPFTKKLNLFSSFLFFTLKNFILFIYLLLELRSLIIHLRLKLFSFLLHFGLKLLLECLSITWTTLGILQLVLMLLECWVFCFQCFFASFKFLIWLLQLCLVCIKLWLKS